MNNRSFQGLALILFGILLCLGSGELNTMVLKGGGYIPFTLFAAASGVAGLLLIFAKGKDKNGK